MEQNRTQLAESTARVEQNEIDLGALLSSYLSRWYFVLAGLLVGILIAGAYTYFLVTPKYTATSKIYMVSNSSDSIVNLSDLNIGTSLSNDYKELLKVRPILEEIADEEHLPYSYEAMSGMINISTIANTRILVISVTSVSPKEAQVIANALADKAVEKIPVLMDTARPNIAERAIVPTGKSSPSMRRNVLIGGLLGLVAVLAILTFFFLMDDTITTSAGVEKVLGIMPMTVIPEGTLPEAWENAESLEESKKSRRKKVV